MGSTRMKGTSPAPLSMARVVSETISSPLSTAAAAWQAAPASGPSGS